MSELQAEQNECCLSLNGGQDQFQLAADVLRESLRTVLDLLRSRAGFVEHGHVEILHAQFIGFAFRRSDVIGALTVPVSFPSREIGRRDSCFVDVPVFTLVAVVLEI